MKRGPKPKPKQVHACYQCDKQFRCQAQLEMHVRYELRFLFRLTSHAAAETHSVPNVWKKIRKIYHYIFYFIFMVDFIL